MGERGCGSQRKKVKREKVKYQGGRGCESSRIREENPSRSYHWGLDVSPPRLLFIDVSLVALTRVTTPRRQRSSWGSLRSSLRRLTSRRGRRRRRRGAGQPQLSRRGQRQASVPGLTPLTRCHVGMEWLLHERSCL